LEIDFPGLVFVGLGSLEGNFGFVEVDVSSFFFVSQVNQFIFGILEPDSEFPGSLDFVFLEDFEVFAQLSFESIEEGEDLRSQILGHVAIGLDEFNISVISLSSEFVEFLEGVFIEQVFVGSEFLGSIFDLDEFFSTVG